MAEFIDWIVEFFALWGPSITAVAGIVASAVLFIKRFRELASEVKKDNYVQELRQKYEIKINSDEELKILIRQLIKKNDELQRENKLLIDEIHGLRGYADETLNNN